MNFETILHSLQRDPPRPYYALNLIDDMRSKTISFELCDSGLCLPHPRDAVPGRNVIFNPPFFGVWWSELLSVCEAENGDWSLGYWRPGCWRDDGETLVGLSSEDDMEKAIRGFLERNPQMNNDYRNLIGPRGKMKQRRKSVLPGFILPWPMRLEAEPKECSHSTHGDSICGVMGMVPGRPCHLLVDDTLRFQFIAEACFDEDNGRDLIEDPELEPLIREGRQLEGDSMPNSDMNGDLLNPECLKASHVEKIRDHSDHERDTRLDRIRKISDELAGRLTRRRVGIRPGRITVDGVLGTYHPGQRLVTLYPHMMELVAKSGLIRGQFPGVALESLLPLIYSVVEIHELCHAWSHAGLDPVGRKEWETGRMWASPVGIHEIIAEYFSWRFCCAEAFVWRRTSLQMMHLALCENAPEEYRLWQLLDGLPLERVQRALQSWRVADMDTFITTALEEFLRDRGAELCDIWAQDENRLRSVRGMVLGYGNDSNERLQSPGRIVRGHMLSNLWDAILGDDGDDGSETAVMFREWLKQRHPEREWVLDRTERMLQIAEHAASGPGYNGGGVAMIAARPVPFDDTEPEIVDVLYNHLSALLALHNLAHHTTDGEQDHETESNERLGE